MASQREIRKEALEHRRNIDPEKRRSMDLDIYNECISMPAYKNAEYVLCYVNYNDEVDTHRLIRRAIQENKKVYVPKVLDPSAGEMDFYSIDSLAETEKGYHGIPEPEMNVRNSFEPVYSAIDWSLRKKILIIVPGVAFDRKLNRIGYGRGFYDRYLSAHSEAVSVGLCYDCQLYADGIIQCSDKDVKVRQLITNE